MPSAVTSVKIATVTQPIPAADAQATSTKTTAQTIEQTLAGIAEALSAFHQSSRPQRHERSVFTKIERVLSSLTKLVEAFAKLRNAEPDPGKATKAQDVPTQAHTVESSATSNVEVLQPPGVSLVPSTEEPTPTSVEQSAITPQPAPTPSETPTTETLSSDMTVERAAIDLGGTLGKTGEFLWKPESEKDGNLAILLPSSLTGRVREVCVLMPDGSRALQRGHYAGVGNGSREHYRFSKPGRKFPDGAIVLIKLENGSTRHLKISDTAKRVTR